jgi:hypothetical protein
MRFTPADLAILDALQEHTGISNQTDVLRLALRALADREGLRLAPIVRSAKQRPLPASHRKEGPRGDCNRPEPADSPAETEVSCPLLPRARPLAQPRPPSLPPLAYLPGLSSPG